MDGKIQAKESRLMSTLRLRSYARHKITATFCQVGGQPKSIDEIIYVEHNETEILTSFGCIYQDRLDKVYTTKVVIRWLKRVIL